MWTNNQRQHNDFNP